MPRTNLRILAVMAIVSILSLGWAMRGDAVEFFMQHGRRCNKRAIEAHGYRTYDKVQTAHEIAIASMDQSVEVKQYVPRAGYPGEQTEISVERKLFPLNVESITAGGLSLARVGLTIYRDGRYACTGVLSFDGGVERSLHGANAAVLVRAYSATPQEEGDLLNGRLLWETRREFFVRRDEDSACSLLPDARPRKAGIVVPVRNDGTAPPSDLIVRHFGETTHLEVVLERYTDR